MPVAFHLPRCRMMKRKIRKKTKKALKEEQKKLKKMLSSGKHTNLDHILRIRPTSVNEKVPELYKTLKLPMRNLKIFVKDLSKRYFPNSKSKSFKIITASDISKNSINQSLNINLPNMNTGAEEVFEVAISYEILGETISYRTKLVCPEPEARNYIPFLTKVKVTGYLSTDYIGQASTKVVLENGDKVGCETRFQPLDYIPAGAPVEFEISPDNVWAHVVRSAKLLDKDFNRVSLQPESGNYTEGMKLSANQTVLEFSFSPTEVGSIYSNIEAGRSGRIYDVWLKTKSGWIKAASCEKDGWQYLVPMKASGVKIVFEKGREATLKKLRLFKPSKSISSNGFW